MSLTLEFQTSGLAMNIYNFWSIISMMLSRHERFLRRSALIHDLWAFQRALSNLLLKGSNWMPADTGG